MYLLDYYALRFHTLPPLKMVKKGYIKFGANV